MKPIALDLFCCAGGASHGLVDAGFDVVGVDVEVQPEYPYLIHRGDALDVLARLNGGGSIVFRRGVYSRTVVLAQFALIWASPPCQKFTAYRRRNPTTTGHLALNLIPETRSLLIASRKPFIIENVIGAPLRTSTMLCGSMFGLDVRRHRLFECSFYVEQPRCFHEHWTPRFRPASNRANDRLTVEVGVRRIPLEVQRAAMDIDWMSREKLSQAIPPAYSRWLGMRALERAVG